MAQPFSNGGQEIVKENNNIEMENEMSEHPRISADCPLLQKEEEQIEIVSSCWIKKSKYIDPLIEKLNTDELYVPNDLCIGLDKDLMSVTV